MLAGARLRWLHPRGGDLPSNLRQLPRRRQTGPPVRPSTRALSRACHRAVAALPEADGSWMVVRSVGGLVDA